MTITNKLNGNAAENVLKLILREFGFLAKCPVTQDQILEELIFNSINHFESALYYVEKEYGSLEVGPGVLADYALATDMFVTDHEEKIASLDVTVNNSSHAYNHKMRVKAKTQSARKRLGFGRHLLVVVDGHKTYQELTQEEKWEIVDLIMLAYALGDEEVHIDF